MHTNSVIGFLRFCNLFYSLAQDMDKSTANVFVLKHAHLKWHRSTSLLQHMFKTAHADNRHREALVLSRKHKFCLWRWEIFCLQNQKSPRATWYPPHTNKHTLHRQLACNRSHLPSTLPVCMQELMQNTGSGARQMHLKNNGCRSSLTSASFCWRILSLSTTSSSTGLLNNRTHWWCRIQKKSPRTALRFTFQLL